MDLFPKDFKKNTSPFSSSGAGASVSSLFGKLKTGLSSGSGNFSVSSRAKETFMRLAVVFSGAVFILVLLLWGGLYFYKKSLVNQVSDLKKQQAEVFDSQDKELAAKIVDFENGSALVQGLLKNHVYSSNLFARLEDLTLPNVQWQTFSFSKTDNHISARGFSSDYSGLAKQILALQGGGFYNLSVGDISLDKTGGVAFQIVFNFDPKILQKHE